MNSRWTASLARDGAPAPDLTPIDLTDQLSVPREALDITVYYMATIVGFLPPTAPRWTLKDIFKVVNYLFPDHKDFTDEDFGLMMGFAYQPSAIHITGNLTLSVDVKILRRLCTAYNDAFEHAPKLDEKAGEN